jgi:hypothetical protein
MDPEPHDDAENDSQERDGATRVAPGEDGSNVVSVDFGRKK